MKMIMRSSMSVLIASTMFILPACASTQANTKENKAAVKAATEAATAAAAAAATSAAAKASDAVKTSTFTLPALPYAENALEVAIDAQTMNIHHTKHHQAYVNGLNTAVAANAELSGLTLEQLVANAGKYGAAVRNNGGGHWNHSFFWESLAAPAQTGAISPELKTAIDQSFGSVDNFKAEFKKAGLGRFGSGWAWLIVGQDGKLAITSTPNQDNPLMDVAEVKGTPLLGNDVWEHAYYLKYQNRRADYLDAFWQIVNWNKISERYKAATGK